MTIKHDNENYEIHIDDLGVTMRTLMAVAAKGYSETGRRRWYIIYKGARISVVQVASTPRPGSH